MASAHIKTRVMNWVLAVLYLILGIALLFNKASQSIEILGIVLVTYLVFVALPIASAFALRPSASPVFRLVMLVLNATMIALAVLSVAGGIYFRTPAASMVSALVIAIPAAINVYGLKPPESEDGSPTRNSLALISISVLGVTTLLGAAFLILRESTMSPSEIRQATGSALTYNRTQSEAPASQRTSGWRQPELNEAFMRSLSKDECMAKTMTTVGACTTNECAKNAAGIVGDCVTWASGSTEAFCKSFQDNYLNRYCSGKTERQCLIVRSLPPIFCSPR
jgi:hypothetical protein